MICAPHGPSPAESSMQMIQCSLCKGSERTDNNLPNAGLAGRSLGRAAAIRFQTLSSPRARFVRGAARQRSCLSSQQDCISLALRAPWRDATCVSEALICPNIQPRAPRQCRATRPRAHGRNILHSFIYSGQSSDRGNQRSPKLKGTWQHS